VRQDNYNGALFVAANGYHHHLGLNTWASAGAPSPPTNSVGLDAFTIAIPNTETLEAIANRFKKANITFEKTQNKITTQDGDNNTLILSEQ